MAKVLVTGSEGSLGQALINKLIYSYEMFGADNLYKHKKYSTKAGRDYWFKKVDLTDPILTQELIHEVKPDYIFQCAAKIYGVGGFNKYCADILGDDITLHRNVLDASIKNKVKRVVFISSSMVYEKSYSWQFLENEPDVNSPPATDYGLSKYVNERLSRSYQKQYGLDYMIWRPFNIITPFEEVNDFEIGVSHVFADYIQNLVVEKMNPLPIIGDGNQIRCFTWIDDVADAIANYSLRPDIKNDVFNVGNKEPVTMKELAKLIVQTSNELGYPLPEVEFQTIKSFPNDVTYRIPNVTKLEKLGWTAKTKLKDSVKQCVEHKLRTIKW